MGVEQTQGESIGHRGEQHVTQIKEVDAKAEELRKVRGRWDAVAGPHRGKAVVGEYEHERQEEALYQPAEQVEFQGGPFSRSRPGQQHPELRVGIEGVTLPPVGVGKVERRRHGEARQAPKRCRHEGCVELAGIFAQ
jgi:hypothetical protein